MFLLFITVMQMNTFLGLTSETETTGEVFCNALKSLLLKFNLQLKNCIDFGTHAARSFGFKNQPKEGEILRYFLKQ